MLKYNLADINRKTQTKKREREKNARKGNVDFISLYKVLNFKQEKRSFLFIAYIW